LKIQNRKGFLFFVIAIAIGVQSCSMLGKKEFSSMSSIDLAALAESFPEPAKRALSQNEAQRKQLIETFKKSFSLAQAAEAEGLEKSDKFKRQLGLTIDSLLATEHKKRNPTVNISKEEADAYYASHKEEYEADLKTIFEDQPTPPGDDMKELFKTQWSNVKVLSEKARQSGLEKEQLFAIQVKFRKANMLAEFYREELGKRYKLTPEEKTKYIAEHPEADPEKVKQNAEGILDRVKKGESFEKLFEEVKQDISKGRGEELGWFSRGGMDPAFETAAFAMKKGETSSELVKTKFGYHIIRVDDKRTTKQPAAPPNLMAPAPGGAPNPGGSQSNQTVEEVRARHILISTKEADEFEQRLIDEKVKKAMDEAAGKYPVTAPADFAINVQGQDPKGGLVPGNPAPGK
jgi:parvulin-like peptidyl-prolyl isomerase